MSSGRRAPNASRCPQGRKLEASALTSSSRASASPCTRPAARTAHPRRRTRSAGPWSASGPRRRGRSRASPGAVSFATGCPSAFWIAILTSSPVYSFIQKVSSAPSFGFSPRKTAAPFQSANPGSGTKPSAGPAGRGARLPRGPRASAPRARSCRRRRRGCARAWRPRGRGRAGGSRCRRPRRSAGRRTSSSARRGRGSRRGRTRCRRRGGCGFLGSSRTTLTGPSAGRSPATLCQVRPRSPGPVGERRELAGAVRLDGEVGDLRRRAPRLDAAHPLVLRASAGRLAVRSVQCAPSSSVTQSLPSSVPAQSSPFCGATRRACRRRRSSRRRFRSRSSSSGPASERSGLIAVHLSPRSVSRKTRLPARYSVPFSWRLPMSGEFQWKRKRGLALGRRGPQALDVPRSQVEAVELALLRLGVDDVASRRVEDAVEAVAAADVDPVGVQDPFLACACGSARPSSGCPGGRRRSGTGRSSSRLIR